MKRLTALFAACALVFGCIAFAACEEEPRVEASSVTLDTEAFTLTVGETKTLTATVLPENASDKTVTWTSSDTEVATVAEGTVTAVAEGTATITATCGTAAATAVCTVESASEYEEVPSEKWAAAFDVFSNEEYRLDMDEASFAQGETPAYEDMLEYAVTDGKEELLYNSMSADAIYSEKIQSGYRIYQIQSGFWTVFEEQTSLREQVEAPFWFLEQLFSVFAGEYDSLKDAFNEETGMYAGALEVDGTVTDVALAFRDAKVCKIMIVGEGGTSSGSAEDGSADGTDGTADTGNASGGAQTINYISYSISIIYETEIALPAPAPLPAFESEQADASVWETAFDFDRLDNFGMTVDIAFFDADGQAERFGQMMDYARADGKEMFFSALNSETLYSVRTQEQMWQIYALTDDAWAPAGQPSDTSAYVTGGLEDALLPFAQVTFSFDAEKGCYVGEAAISDAPATLSVWLADGKILCLFVEAEENGTQMQYMFSFSYGDQAVELPFEV